MQTNINTGFSHLPNSTSYFPKGSMLIPEDDFVSFITVKQNLAQQSIRHCKIRIRKINLWFSDKELTGDNVEKFFLELRNQGLKNNSLNTYYFVFRQIVEYCKDRNLPSDFLRGFKSFKKTKSEIIIFTNEEIEKMINTSMDYSIHHGKDCQFLDFVYKTLTTFLAYTGCRYSEVANLKVKNIDWDGKARIVETKTNVNRVVYFNDPLLGNLKRLCENKDYDDFIFLNSLGKQINYQTYSDDLKKRARKAGVTKRVFPHNFRHSYITHLLEAGVPITEVATLVGHKDIQTTYSTYMHLADKTLFRAAMRHPSVRKNVDTKEIIKTVKENFENLHLESDTRFDYSMSEDSNNLTIKISVI